MYVRAYLINVDYRIDKCKNIRRIAFTDKRNVLSLKVTHSVNIKGQFKGLLNEFSWYIW